MIRKVAATSALAALLIVGGTSANTASAATTPRADLLWGDCSSAWHVYSPFKGGKIENIVDDTFNSGLGKRGLGQLVNDNAASIRVQPGTKVILYTGRNGEGFQSTPFIVEKGAKNSKCQPIGGLKNAVTSIKVTAA